LTSAPRLIAVGIVGRRHGLAGEVSLESLGDFAGLFEPGARFTWKAGNRARELKVAARRQQGRRLILSFEGIADPEAARELTGGVLCVPRERLPGIAPDFYWTHEIEGWRCEDLAGGALGIVGLLEETPAGPQLTLEAPGGKRVLVPFVRPLVVEIDRDGRRIVLDLPEGLMDL
jgi:16S rRNA processing protein RimM